ncbi:MAG: hypothetical protein MZW92_42680 [Comamonadaceae bacterium]|nr:hypothetical protein [Comamonadaceae bacterium]
MTEDADHVVIGLGSVTDDAEAVAAYLRGQGKKVGVISVKMLQPFPEAEVVAALARQEGGHRARTLRGHLAHQPGDPRAVQGPGERQPRCGTRTSRR